MNEDNLIKNAKAGESEAFGKLYDNYLPAIYRYIFIRVGSRKADAEDLTHQVFLSAWQNIKNYKFQGFPFSSWLYRIAHNAVIDYYRGQKPKIDISEVSENVFADSPDLEKSIDDTEEIKKVKIALAKLEPDQQSVLLMKFVNELSNQEISEALGKTEGAIRVIQHRGLKQLKKIMGDNNETPKTTTV